MKTILTFVGGGERDEVILQTALAVALPLSTRIDCVHAHVHATRVAQQSKFGSAPASVLRNTLERLQANADSYSRSAADNVRAACRSAGIPLDDGSPGSGGVTATFFEEATNDLDRLRALAAQRDLIVIGRARQKQGLTSDTFEYLVRNSGRPILAAGRSAPRTLTGTIMVCWKDDGSTAVAMRDAAPLLAKAGRLVLVSVAKRDNGLAATMAETAREVTGIDAEVRIVPAGRLGVPEALAEAADEYGADLVVIGAYGRPRLYEILFGSCTDHILVRCDRPILLRH